MQKIELIAADGYRLGAQFYPVASSRKIVLIAPATAVPQGFYRRFALAMNARGYSALSVDYRGVGSSKPATLKGFHANYRLWGQTDLAAAFDYASQFGDVYLAGHSFGGHGLGMIPQAKLLKAAWICGTGAGYSGYMSWFEPIKVQLLWNLLAPIGVALKGYAPMSWFGIGEDLPLGVYHDWKFWCAMPQYFFSDPALVNSDFIKRFHQLAIPIQFVNALDDKWALPKSRDAFVSGYQSAEIQRVDLKPSDYGTLKIGHMGYFRPAMAKLWEQAADFFDGYQ
jgi:predicted alpha/beta hydrolase